MGTYCVKCFDNSMDKNEIVLSKDESFDRSRSKFTSGDAFDMSQHATSKVGFKRFLRKAGQTKVKDTYEEQEKLGQGAFGTVFKVKHRQTG